MNLNYAKLDLIKCEFKQRMCPLVFKDLIISNLTIEGMLDSFLKTNVLKFYKFNMGNIRLNSKIHELELVYVYNVNSNLEIINPDVFNQIEVIKIAGSVNLEINELVFVQFFKIVFEQFLGTALRFLANFTYLAFSRCRLSLIGKEHGKLVMHVSKDSTIRTYPIITSLICLILAVVKYFRFLPVYSFGYFSDDFSDLSYPERFSMFSIINIKQTEVRVYMGFDCFVDLVNYILFMVVFLVLDIKMVKELKKTLKEREKLDNSERKKRENEQAINRAILLAILNLIWYVFLKSPILVNSILEFIVHEISRSLFEKRIYFLMYVSVNFFLGKLNLIPVYSKHFLIFFLCCRSR